MLSLILASTPNGIIGVDGKLPWAPLKEDLEHFKSLTTGRAVIMGRKTYESIGRPLPNRYNIVVSKSASNCLALPRDVVMRRSVEEASADACTWSEFRDIGEWFVIGGASIYEALLPKADRIYWTEVSPSLLSRGPNAAEDYTRWTFDRSKWWQTGVCAGKTAGVTFYRFDRRIP
jgi:dihydrofolate reductase